MIRVQGVPVSPAEVEGAAARLAEAPGEAERRARALLARSPADPRLLLVLASARRRQGDWQGALGVLESLARAHPRAANTRYELGMARLAGGQVQAAAEALREATALNRDLPDAWRALGDILFARGDVRGADAAFAEHGRAKLPSPRLKAAADALAAGRAEEAQGLIRAHLSAQPRDVLALRLLGEALDRLGRYGEAEAVLDTALRLDPGFEGARFTLATVLFHQQKAPAAEAHVRTLLARDLGEPSYRNLLAACLSLAGDLGEAEAIYRDLLLQFPSQPQLWLNHAQLLRTVGRPAEAAEAYRRAIALAPDLGEAYWALANLKVEGFTEEEVAAMRRALARPDARGVDRMHLGFALGKALEDRGEDEAALASYAAGAAIRRAGIAYSADRTTAEAARARGLLTPAFFAARAGGGAQARDPVFIVGLPRSGTTLVEQILASHSAVEGTMELPDLGLIAHRMAAEAGGGDALGGLARLDADARRRLGEDYLESTRRHRLTDRPFFLDKMPNNFRHIGLIQLILPNAKVVDVRRHPLGAGFAVFKQHFADGQLFSYDLEEIGRFYRDYVGWMAHIDAVLPGRVHRVVYEDLVEDTEAEVRRLLAALDLPFEAGCLRFHETRRAVKTVSSEQVRRPIFRDGVETWRRFERWLDPLKTGLGPALDTWRG